MGSTDILRLRLVCDDMVLLSSNQTISVPLEKWSNIYSDRVSGPTILTIVMSGNITNSEPSVVQVVRLVVTEGKVELFVLTGVDMRPWMR